MSDPRQGLTDKFKQLLTSAAENALKNGKILWASFVFTVLTVIDTNTDREFADVCEDFIKKIQENKLDAPEEILKNFESIKDTDFVFFVDKEGNT